MYEMKFYITYFYNIRFFKPNMIPVSTAMYDPRWYHDNKGNSYIYRDKRGVINGIRCNALTPAKVHSADTCSDKCPKRHTGDQCGFINGYKSYLNSLNFEETIQHIEKALKRFGEDIDICLIVYEKQGESCSEQGPLIEWFNEHGYDLKWWSKDMED